MIALLLLATGLAATMREFRKKPAAVGDALVVPPAPPSVPPKAEPTSTVTMPEAAVLAPWPELPPEEQRASPLEVPRDAVAADSCRSLGGGATSGLDSSHRHGTTRAASGR